MYGSNLHYNGSIYSMNFLEFIRTPWMRKRTKPTGKIPVKQLGLSTGVIVVVRHPKKNINNS